MIKASVEYAQTEISVIMELIFSLPLLLRPTRCSPDENEAGVGIGDANDAMRFLASHNLGFVLRKQNILYDLTVSETDSIKLDAYFDFEAALAKPFMAHMALAQPKFGYACVPEERCHRNRLFHQIGANSIESWVGRDTKKYIPGLYWLTLLPEALAAAHSVPLAPIRCVALEEAEFPGGQHLFRFYDRPEDWQSTPAVADLCSSLGGIFDIATVKPQVAAITDVLALFDAVRKWP